MTRCSGLGSRRASRLPLIGALAGAVMAGAHPLPARADVPTFDGITLIELKDPVGQKALGGGGPADYILTFVSGVGTYAATLSANGSRGCIAWAREGSYTGASITFGLARDEYEVRMGNPFICLPFTLTFEGEETVRVSAENNVPESNAAGAAAPLIRYSRKRAVVDRIPLRALDWGLPPFARHHIRNVRLGPVVEGSGATYDVSPLRRSTGGIFKSVKATAAGGETGGPNPDTVLGRAAPQELTGWPWDAVYALWSGRYLTPPSTRSAFEASITELYGEPGFVQEPSGLWYWLYDLDGKLLTKQDAAKGNCLNTMALWEGTSLVTQNVDVGPWGCALVMTLTYGGSDTVSSYRIEVLSGYTKAINHFLTRIEELKEIREKIELIESVEPEL